MPPIRVDRNRNGGDFLIIIKKGVLVKEASLLSSTAKEFEAKSIEINLQKMAACWYLPYPFPSRRFFLGETRRNIEHFCTRYENVLIIGDVSLIESNDSLHDLMYDLNLENIVKETNFFKSVNPTCIDLILTSECGKVSNTRTIETGISGFHAIVPRY